MYFFSIETLGTLKKNFNDHGTFVVHNKSITMLIVYIYDAYTNLMLTFQLTMREKQCIGLQEEKAALKAELDAAYVTKEDLVRKVSRKRRRTFTVHLDNRPVLTDCAIKFGPVESCDFFYCS